MGARRSPLTGLLALALLLATSIRTTAAFAVEVRQNDAGGRYHAVFGRAYAPCLAPNDVTSNGFPACNPAVTSACGFVSGVLDIESRLFVNPQGHIDLELSEENVGPPECQTGTYMLHVAVRVSADDAAAIGGPELACASGQCTFEDTVIVVPLFSPFFVLPLRDVQEVRSNIEIMGVTVVAPDGLPIAAIGTDGIDHVLASNLTVPHPQCTAPEPLSGGLCSVAPWASPCDYESAALTLGRDPGTFAWEAHATFTGVAGSSPLCKSGTHRLQAVVRPTVRACGTPPNSAVCTVVDQTLDVPMTARGRELSAPLAIGAFGGTYVVNQVVSARILDPTGSALAAPGVTSVRSPSKLLVTRKRDQLRVKAVIPVTPDELPLDPTLDAGVRVTVSDRSGVFYDVTVPGVRWQLQPPIGSRWDYVDEGGILAGLRTIRIKRVTKAGVTAGYQVDLRARGVDLSAADFPGATVAIRIARPLHVLPFDAQGNRTCRLGIDKLNCS